MAGWAAAAIAILATGFSPDDGEGVTLRVDAGRVLHKVSPYLLGACIEDVNHEIYGGIDSQMIFGESFAEPPASPPIRGFRAYGGTWTAGNGEVRAIPGNGYKLIADGPAIGSGEVGVEIKFDERRGGNAGLLVEVDRPGIGADAFTGYEISLETSSQLMIGRHRRNWEPIRSVPVDVPLDRWIALTVRFAPGRFEVLVDGKSLATIEDRDHPLKPGQAGIRTWQRPARFRNFRTVDGDKPPTTLAFEPVDPEFPGGGVSGMWAPSRRGSAQGGYSVETARPFSGERSQRIRFDGGEGELGVENRGLNRQGMHFAPRSTYEGYVYARSTGSTPLTVALESADGAKTYASTTVEVSPGAEWARYNFELTTAEGTGPARGRFAIKLARPGTVDLGYAFLQPGDWGRFRGLPDRKDVAEGLIAQGVTVLRYGGSMVNHPGYRWKKMIGPRASRPPGPGTWYAYSSNGWGIFDFLNLCEAAGFLAIPALNVNESPADLADFVEYVNGPPESPWGRKRFEDGHAEPYQLQHIELGNEEAVDEAYYLKFRGLAEAIWARDPAMILVVGDFAYSRVIVDPDRFDGAPSIHSLAAHRKILELAREHDREVWFDIHVTTNQPPEPHDLKPELSFIDQISRMVPGSRSKVVFFEYNSGNRSQKRALSNALATIGAEAIGDRTPIACVANCLQVDGQNDNDWDQGMLFLNPSRTWLSPPGYVIQMARRHALPLLVASEVRGPAPKLRMNAKRSEDGKSLVIQVVHWGDEPQAVAVDLAGFRATSPEAEVDTLAAAWEATNTADQPERVRPVTSTWARNIEPGRAGLILPPRSYSFITFR